MSRPNLLHDSLIFHMIFGLLRTQFFQLVVNTGAVLKKYIYNVYKLFLVYLIYVVNQDCVYTKNIWRLYGIEIDGPDLKRSAIWDCSLQLGTVQLSVFVRILNCDLPKMFLIETPFIGTGLSGGLNHFFRDFLLWWLNIFWWYVWNTFYRICFYWPASWHLN